VQFYEEDEFPAARVGAFLVDAVQQGGGAVVVATGAHLHPICDSMASLGIDVSATARSGQLLLLDAEKILGWLHVGGELNEQQFEGLVGARVREATSRFPRVRFFGEMVDLLAREGRESDALRLEAWWNCLLQRDRFELLCAYSYKSFVHPHSVARFEDVCSAHDRVEATSDVQSLKLDPGRLLAQFRQRSAALKHAAMRSRRLEVERARVLRAEREASGAVQATSWHLARLQRIATALSEAASADAVWEVARTELADATGAVEVVLLVDPEVLLVVGPAVHERDGAGGGYLDVAFRTGTGVWPAAGVSGENAMVALPLEVATRRLGAVGFRFETISELSATERGLMEDLARQLALALDRGHARTSLELAGRPEGDSPLLRALDVARRALTRRSEN
jgi:hypothetical protein